MFKLTTRMYELLKPYEGANKLKIFDTSKEGFVLGFGMTKSEAIERGIIEKQKEKNPLYELCKHNRYIPHQWISQHLSETEYDMFLHFMNGQGQSTYGVFDDDLLRFLTNNQI